MPSAASTSPVVEPTQVPARSIPVPSSVSAKAQAALAPNPMASTSRTFPPSDDVPAWNALISISNENIVAQLDPRVSQVPMSIESTDVAGVTLHQLLPSTLEPAFGSRLVLDIHGGGLVLGAWQASLDGARRTAATYATETVRHGSLQHLFAWPAAVGAVTAADVTAAARKYMDPRSLTAVVVGQIELVRAARHPRWPFALDDVPALLRPSGTGG